jgi:hypothetical protein
VGVPAAEAFAAADILPPLPGLPVPPPVPGPPPALDTETAPPGDLDADALRFLAGDAAARALGLLTDALAPDHEQRWTEQHWNEQELTLSEDAVRLAAADPDGAFAGRLASGTGRRRADLDLAVRAWRFGGPAALAVLEEDQAPDPEALARAGASLDAAWDDGDRPGLRATAPGRWTAAGARAQLRYGADGRWWPYRKERGRWAPAGPADHDPAAALADALTGGQQEEDGAEGQR